MKPLLVLLSVFLLSAAINKIFRGNDELAFSGKMAMSVMLLFTASAHFAFNDGMAMMLPEFVPYKPQVVYLTGIIEIVAAIGLFIPAFSILTAWLLIAFFIIILPANVYAAIKHIDYQKATFNGSGLNYLWFRVPLQMLFIAWVYLSAIKNWH
ncbi:hypothetical protein [Pedobacter sp. MR22-3]|uniref:DoxX family protein n=1 Tax=Pedobacter sp. MR22-3 TaxID=2994552 RepID=UPI0022454F15|nr:hypothetical protein [Pedobacter sp. MR22-3]MCX2583807.1 hypothetical protein [Pedobacter sp. MR22-3]